MTKELPTGWTCDSLDNVCNVKYGTRVVRKRDGGTIYPVYGGGGATFFMDTYNRQNALVVARFAMSEQCTRFVKGKFFLNDSGLTVSPKNKNFLTQSFLDWQLIALNNKIYSLGEGSAQRNLKVDMFRKLNLNIPSLSEQKRIVEKLDKIFANIDKAKEKTTQNLKNAKEVFNSRLQHLFSMEVQNAIFVKLIDLVDITSSKRIFKHEYVPQGVPFYRTKEIKELAHNKPITLELFISENKYKEIKMKFGVPSKNDLLISAVGTIGEMYIVPNEQPFYFKDGNILWIKNYKKDLLPEFLKYALQSYITKIQALAQGTAYNALTIEKLTQYKIPYVDIFAQRTLVSSLDSLFAQTQELEQIYTKKLADLDELKQSVLQQAFSGKL